MTSHGVAAGLVGVQPELPRRRAARATPPTDQPAGSDATHGTAVAVGTDCAISTITDSVPHAGESAIAGSVGVNMPYTLIEREEHEQSDADGVDHPPRPPTLQRDRSSLRRQRPELGEQVAPVALHIRAQLRGAGDAAGGGERLGDLVRREVRQRSGVHPLGVGAQSEDQHHVGEVDGLAPRRRAHLDEGDVDHARGARP